MAAGEDGVKWPLGCPPEHETQKLSSHGDTNSTNSSGTVGLVPGRFEPSSNAAPSSENSHEKVKPKGLSSIMKSFSFGNVPLLHPWTDVLVMLCVILTLLDPLFCYVLVVNEDGNCIRFDEKLRLAIVVLRSIIDFCYIILIILHCRTGYIPSYDANEGRLSVATRYLLSYFTVDILAVLPVTQVMIFFVIPTSKASHFTTTIRSMMLFLALQHWPRILRVFIVLRKNRLYSSIFPNIAEAKAIFNLFLYLLVCHILGAYWYLFSIERRATCLQEVKCHSHSYCPKSYSNSSLEGWCMDACSAKPSSYNTTFNFGIFDDAFKSGVVYSTDFIWKLSYCYWWGLQNLSSLGQGLKTSSYIWEIYFAVSIPISGMVLFALLIGNLQAPFARREELRWKVLDIDRWMCCHRLPKDLRKKIRQHVNHKWQTISGVNVAHILHNLPRELRKDTTRHLGLRAIKSVSMFQNTDKKFLDVVCGYLKPMLYVERDFIIREGEPVDILIFIIHGKSWIYSNSNRGGETSGLSEILGEGDFLGEDLLEWVLKDPFSSTVPISTKTVSTHTEVEAFVLRAKDLKSVVLRFWWLFSLEHRNYPEYGQRLAALVLQTTWRRYIKSKHEKEKSQLSLATESGNSQPTNIHASTIIARAIHAFSNVRKRRNNGSNGMPGPSNINV